MSVRVGDHFGRYEILALLGAGGMGEVYRARDERLHRDVALKIVSADLSGDRVLDERLLNEARAAGALNHPNIVVVHDAGLVDDLAFIVSELVDGESLRQRIPRNGMPIREALDFGAQIADGLAAAHQAGIVHRDLKPENVMVTREKRIKLLDFGLAIFDVPALASDSTSTGLGVSNGRGLIMGTARYMSPEQARGEALDFHSDQFALGVLLYEMVSGRPPFSRDTFVQTLSAIIAEEPFSLATLSPNVPIPLRWIVERCLAKDPRQRYAATADLAHDLRTLRDRLAELVPTVPVVAAPGRWHTASVARTVLACVGILAAVVWSILRLPTGPDLAAYRFTPLATDAGYQGWPSWSPDGKTIAYAAEVDGVLQVFTRSLSSSMSAPITQSQFDCRDPFWSPNGTRIFYTSLARDKDGLWSVTAAGGTPENIIEDASTAAISPDGLTIAFFREEQSFFKTLWFSSPPGAVPRKYARPPFGSQGYSDVVLHFSPDGSKILIRSVRGGNMVRAFWIVPWPDGDPYMVLQAVSGTTGSALPFSWLPDNRRIVTALTEARSPGTHLWLADTEKNTALPITRSNSNENFPAVSPDGGTIAYSSEDTDFDLIEIPADGSRARPLLGTSRNEMDPAWSPTGGQYAFVTDRTGGPQIWLKSQEGQWERPLITEKDFGDGRTFLFGTPAFSSDGQKIAFLRLGPEGYRIWISTVAGGPPVRLRTSARYQDAPTWSPDGTWIAHVLSTNESPWALAKTQIGGSEPPVVIKKDISPFARPQWSPDGQWLVYDSGDGLALISPDGKDSRLLSDEGWLAYGWGADSLNVYGIKQSDDRRHLMFAAINIRSGKDRIITADLGPIPPLNPAVRGFSRIPERGFVTSIMHTRSDVWLLDGWFQSPPGLFERLRPQRRTFQP